MTAPSLDDVLDRLRAAGARVTESRRAVIEALLATDPHPTADVVAATVAKRHPNVHRSTVYRTLDALAEFGIITHVHLGHSGAVYHFTEDAALHAVCERCEAIVHLAPGLLDEAAAAIEAASGFRLQPGHFALPALCPSCLASEPDGPAHPVS